MFHPTMFDRKVTSQCTCCGKLETVSEAVVSNDHYGNFHFCNDCNKEIKKCVIQKDIVK